MRRAEELRLMPMHVEMEWREAQSGQLSRLLIGSDAGWRGDVTAEMKLDGTCGCRQCDDAVAGDGCASGGVCAGGASGFRCELRVLGITIRRAPLRSWCVIRRLAMGICAWRVTCRAMASPKLSLELQKIPAQAVLDALRTVRQELGAGLEADGTLSGKLTYDTTAPPVATPQVKPLHRGKKTMAKQAPAAPGP